MTLCNLRCGNSSNLHLNLFNFINSISQTDEFKMLAVEQSAKSYLLAPGGGRPTARPPLATDLHNFVSFLLPYYDKT